MKNKSMLVMIMMGSILSFLPQVLWAGGMGEATLRALKKLDAQQARLSSQLQRLDTTDPSFSNKINPSLSPEPRVSPIPVIRFGDLRLTCEGEARQDYNRCLEGQEEQCGEELQPYTPTIAGTPYLVCPSSEEITDLPCRELQSDSLEICTCRQEEKKCYEDCLQSSSWILECITGCNADYGTCSLRRQFRWN